ncbi:hypothetical protein BU24DRAFT_418110 [Aaosphaeria arxii CBS 175.79]|uniref:Zn(2)-C6 fungal-type domain-containing protein n=1 Tax=Aaosphaeria arxii CBS 175.79 TaxID=1450172 RepID=A0A6A5XZ67_9PLEO|nr:uncharacterized protein BU24DRAFT_418110 [Aaosphaeria arxii CBS 175.79]KAF2018588.1 hypothetical protein BU24DRAFT_418110 [Aaosphaeria arxii CBS 175.79]
MRKRSRACEECHRLKIKCDVGTSSSGICDRCTRNSLECTPAAPRLQRDRIKELESQVQELRNVLREQSNSTTPSRSPGSLPLLENSHENAILSLLDARIPLSRQQPLLDFYLHHAGAAWPLIRVPSDLDRIRLKSPILLLSILVYTVTHATQGTELEVHDELVRETMHMLGEEVVGRGQRSLELVQALLVAALWVKTTRKGYQGSCYQIVQLAVDMAIDIGIAGFALQPSPVAYFDRHEDETSAEARRTWLACFVAASTSSMSMRRPSAVSWDGHHQECMLYLECVGDPLDMLMCQIVRITQIIQEISKRLSLCELTSFVDANDYSIHTVMEELKSKVDAWAAQIPTQLASSSTLNVLRHIAMIYIYEPVLHTPTNKPSFAAPFIPGRIPIKDFPKPLVAIPPLQSALEAIVFHCHSVIDTIAEMDPEIAISLPTFCFTPTVVYALFVLVTVLVAGTDPANTYGRFLPTEIFHIEECGLKLRELTAKLKDIDPTMSCYTVRMFDATSWLEEWYNNYTAILRRYESNLAN